MKKKNINEERMLEIMHSFDNSKENFKEAKEVDENPNLIAEQTRLKAMISKNLNKDFKNENYYVAGSFQTGGQGKTVNSFLDSYSDNTINKTPKPAPTALKPDEALEVSLKRTLKSGTPINNVSFYDEVNWNLMNLGFPAVNAIKIKEQITDMLGE